MLPVPLEGFFHPLAGKTVADELGVGNGTFPQPVAAPPVTFIGVGRILKPIAPQHVNDKVLNRLNGRRKVGDVMVRVGV